MKDGSRYKKKILTAFFLIGLALLPGAATAALTIAPTLVLIEGRRYADISLINTGDNITSYQVGWIHYRMEDETGYYQKVEKSLTDFDLPEHLAITPKRVTLGARGVQKIRMGLRLKGEPPPPGDYRAHLQIQEIPGGIGPGQNTGKKGASVGVSLQVGFTIPVVYRVGASDAKAEIGEVTTRVNPNQGKIEVLVPITKSESKYGILGNLLVYYDDKVVGQVKNANIFSETKNRTFSVSLKVNELSGGALRIVYKDQNTKKSLVYAEKTVPIGR